MDTADLRNGLTGQQEAFCMDFVWFCDGELAYRRNYNVSDPEASWHKSEAWKLLQKPDVRARVEELKAMKAEFVGIHAGWLVEQLREVHARCMNAEPVLDNKGTPTGEWTFNATGATRALEMLGKHIGFADASGVRAGTEPLPWID